MSEADPVPVAMPSPHPPPRLLIRDRRRKVRAHQKNGNSELNVKRLTSLPPLWARAGSAIGVANVIATGAMVALGYVMVLTYNWFAQVLNSDTLYLDIYAPLPTKKRTLLLVFIQLIISPIVAHSIYPLFLLLRGKTLTS